jgi:dimethylhistidine N-methyltransferase
MNATAQGVVRFYDLAPSPDSFLDAVIAGLGRAPKEIPQLYLHDARGRELAAQRRELEDYNITRAEMRIVLEHIAELAEFAGAESILVEIGNGNPHATRVVAAALRPLLYVPLDNNGERNRQAARELQLAMPWLNISGVCADYARPLHLPEWSGVAYRRKVGYLAGPVFSQFTAGEAYDFLRTTRRLLGDGGALLVGVDLKTDSRVLHAAYNDAQGISARFNLNLIERMNRELGAGFKAEAFAHHAAYDAAKGRVEMHVRSKRAQTAAVGSHVFDFTEGEDIHTAVAAKYEAEEFQALAREAGFAPDKVWVDADRLYSVHGLAVI